MKKYIRIAAVLFSIASVAQCLGTPRALFQDELIKDSDTIAVVQILDREFTKTYGEIRLEDDTADVQTSIILYQSLVKQPIRGRLPREPMIFQFTDLGDRNPLSKNDYIVFLKSEGFLFRIVDAFEIDSDTAFWFKGRFIAGDTGPTMEEVSLDRAIREIQQLIKQYGES